MNALRVAFAAVAAAGVSLCYAQEDSATRIAALIEGLGSDDPQERTDAVEALQDIGAPAIPSLQAALEAKDPEVRERAGKALDGILPERALAPSAWVELPHEEMPLRQAIEDAVKQARRSAFFGGLDIEGKRWPGGGGRVAFWEALDRLCGAGRLAYRPPFSEEVVLQESSEGWRAGPACYHGAIRLLAVAGRGSIELDLQWEPHVALLAVADPVILTEAVDDRGRSLLSSDPDESPRFFRIYGDSEWSSAYGDGPLNTHEVHVDLSRPEPDAKGISLHRGRLPIVVIARSRTVSFEDLAGNVGRTFELGETRVTLESMGKDGSQDAARFTARGLASCRPKAPGAETLESSWFLQFGEERKGGLLETDVLEREQEEDGCAVDFLPDAKPPFLRAYRVTVFDRCLYWEMPFEFRDLPLPPDEK